MMTNSNVIVRYKKVLFVFSGVLLLLDWSFAQGINNNGATIDLTLTSNLYIDGTTGHYKSQSNGIIKNSGTAGACNIYLKGDWTNNSAGNTGFQNLGSTVYFIGAAAQTISGTNTSAFDNIQFEGAGLKSFNNTATVATLATVISPAKVFSLSGSLTFLSSATKNANLVGYGGNINNVSASRYMTGDVSVQSWYTGGVGYRRYRFASSPINDAVTPASPFKKTYEQFKTYMYVTGSSGTGGSFDAGSTTNTIQTYDETKSPEVYSYYGIPNITTASTPGVGFTLFFRGSRGTTVGRYAAPFITPEQ
ncbi:MAG: hypothetical protein JWQ25_37, partial [Daejeonella sp.]|nr:hypothetical protein [Daejeonella sp.]